MAHTTESDWITEDALATALKVDRSVLRAKRPYLLAGEVDQKNGAVLWLVTAAMRVAGELGVPFLSVEKTSPAGPSERADDGVETLTVISRALNPNIVNAQRADGSGACVRVADNRKYVPKLANGQPMTLRAKKSTAGNWWVLVGREPRWPGIW